MVNSFFKLFTRFYNFVQSGLGIHRLCGGRLGSGGDGVIKSACSSPFGDDVCWCSCRTHLWIKRVQYGCSLFDYWGMYQIRYPGISPDQIFAEDVRPLLSHSSWRVLRIRDLGAVPFPPFWGSVSTSYSFKNMATGTVTLEALTVCAVSLLTTCHKTKQF